MRSDMHKVIVERPRRLGSSWKNRKTALRLSASERSQAITDAEDYDSGHRRASSARHEKGLNENLAPLKRYLMAQVGRPWNKVYSEICRTIDTRSAIGLHVLQHVEDFIAVDTYIENGQVFERNRRWFMRSRGLYVHPVTGIIRLPKRRQSKPKRPELSLVAVSEMFEYEKIDGLWFQMEYRACRPDELAQNPGMRRVLVRKSQCDRKTIRQIEQGKLGRQK